MSLKEQSVSTPNEATDVNGTNEDYFHNVRIMLRELKELLNNPPEGRGARTQPTTREENEEP